MYTELHAASAFSFLTAASAPEDIAQTAADLGLPAVALLDRDNRLSDLALRAEPIPDQRKPPRTRGCQQHVRADLGGTPAQLIRKSGARADRDRVSAALEATADMDPDPEDLYYFSAIMASTGYPAPALRLLRKAVERGYLSYPAMDRDPLFESIRKDPEFDAIRAEAIRWQKAFVARRAEAPGR